MQGSYTMLTGNPYGADSMTDMSPIGKGCASGAGRYTIETQSGPRLIKGSSIESTSLRYWLHGKPRELGNLSVWLVRLSQSLSISLKRLLSRLLLDLQHLLSLPSLTETGGGLETTSVLGTGHSNECGKMRYDDKKSAITQMNFCLRRRGRHGRAQKLRAYHCPDCNGWHLTKQVKD